MRFELRAITQEGRVESVDFHALDEASAREQAASRGLTVLTIRRRSDLRSFWLERSDRFPVLLFSQELLVLLDAGLSLVEAIETLTQKEREPDFRTVLERILSTLRQGRSLSTALEQFPNAFSPLYIATIRASEKTSDLAPALLRYVAYQNQVEAIRKRLVNASIYPALLMAVGALVGMFLLLYVVPRFSRIYEDRSADLPLFSKLLLYWGRTVEGHAMPVIGVVALLLAALWYVARLPAMRAAMEKTLWELPAIGERMKTYQLARFYRTIGMLLKGGMPLVAALDMGAELLHPVLRARLSAASRAISEGRLVSESMERNRLTTPVALRMLTVGEHSGNMGEMMDRIALFHDEEISRWVDWFTRLFEPILMAVIGVVIGTIVILMYMPIFELAGNLQ
ncbi:MAG: type II secretion system F family protein [Betaproteobacteria bacterium]|nr:type II secretion system F family protein [Betaproteobacteria bacterium]